MTRVPRFSARTGALAIILGASALSAAPARAELIYGLNGTNQLFTFDSATPGAFSSLSGVAGTLTTVTGLGTGFTLEDIDLRPSLTAANNSLYGLARNGSALQLHTIDKTTGVVLTTVSLSLVAGGAAPPATAFAAVGYAIDFNPQADALRILNDNGQNFRIGPANLTTGNTFTDVSLTTTIGTVGAAYTNSFGGTGSTTLYDIGAGTDALYTQNPPNNGQLNQVGTGLGANITGEVGFDISGASSVAYAAVNGLAAISTFHTINLTTGAASAPLVFSANVGTVRGIAAPIGAAAPEPGSAALAAAGLLGAFVIRRRRRA